MPDDFQEALERFDVSFIDFQSMGELIERLDQVLNRPSSVLQQDIALVVLQTQRQQAVDLGFSVDRFTRAGRTVTQLRDRFGRFVATGARDIARRLSQGSG